MDHTNLVLAAPAALRPWISQLWVARTPASQASAREHVLPSGQMHLVVRVSGPPLRLLEPDDAEGPATFHGPVIGGARDRFYAKETRGDVWSVGAVLRPGASLALFGVSAGELAGRHTALADLCGTQADTLHARLAQSRDPHLQLALLSQWLAHHLPDAGPAITPMMQHALDALAPAARIGALVRASRYSHRGFIAQFRQATGLAPKRYARLTRFRQLLADLHGQPLVALGDLALQHGYSDQAHMTREFRVMAGTTPTLYRARSPRHAYHLPMTGAR